MPMRGELYIPAGHPLAPAQSESERWRQVIAAPDVPVIIGITMIGLLLSLYLAVCVPLPVDADMLMIFG